MRRSSIRFHGILFLLASLAASAPASCLADPWFGFEAGANIASGSTNSQFNADLIGLADGSTGSVTGILFGAFLDTEMSDIFHLMPELRFVQKGLSVSAPDGAGGTATVDFTADYIEIPILIKARFVSPVGVAPYLIAGPNVGFKVSQSASGNDSIVGSYNLPSSSPSFKTVDFAIDFGAGMEFAVVEDIKAFVQARYSLGLINIAEGLPDSLFLKSRGIQLSAGMEFNLL